MASMRLLPVVPVQSAREVDWHRPFKSRHDKNSGDHECGHRNFCRSVIIGFLFSNKIAPYPYPQGVRLWSNGFSHDLRNSPPDCFLPSLRSGRSFESRHNKNSGDHICGLRNFGRSVGIRTRGLLDPNQARYQASPHPDSHNIIMKFPILVK